MFLRLDQEQNRLHTLRILATLATPDLPIRRMDFRFRLLTVYFGLKQKKTAGFGNRDYFIPST